MGLVLAMLSKRVVRVVFATALILMVPLVAMRFTDEVNWDETDFAVAGSLLMGTGLMYELLTRKVSDVRHRAAIGIALAAALFIIWAELAVGLVGTPLGGQ